MRRRTLLRRVAGGATLTGLAGCLERHRFRTAGDSATPTLAPTDSPTPRAVDDTADGATETATYGAPRAVSVGGVEDAAVRSAFEVAASVEVTRPRVTADHTARVEVTLENHGDRGRTLTYEAPECDMNALFGGSVAGDARLVLAPAESGWAPASDRCWRARHEDVSCGIPVTTHEVDLPPGESVVWPFDLWATPSGACMPPGRYRFERAFDEGAATVALTLAVRRPDS